MINRIPSVNYTSTQYPLVQREHLDDVIAGKIRVRWDGESMIEPFGANERHRLATALDCGWLFVKEREDGVAKVFFRLQEYARKPWVRVKQVGATAEVSLDLLPAVGQHLTGRGAERIWNLCRPHLKGEVSLVINDWTILDCLRASKATPIAEGFVEISRNPDAMSTDHVDLRTTIDDLVTMWREEKETRTGFYQAHLRSPKWRELRAQVIERAGGRCQLCGLEGVTLFGHHNTYVNLGNEQPEDVIALCRDCHAIGDQRRRERRDGLTEN